MATTVKENISTANLNSLQPYITNQDDFDEPDDMYSYLSQIFITLIFVRS